MRKRIGILVCVAGFGGLAYLATTTHAQRIQDRIISDITTVSNNTASSNAGLPIHVQVSGRDVIVTGQAVDQAALDTLKTTYLAVSGVRVVDVDGVTLLPVADPFELHISKTQNGALAVTGVAPSDAARTQLGARAGDVTLAAGAPNGWVPVALAAQAALGALQSGELTLSDRTLTMTGTALRPTDQNAALAHLEGLPDGFNTDVQIDVLDDGTPFRLTLMIKDGAIAGVGKLPSVLEQDTADLPLDLVISPLPAQDPDWPDVARTVLQVAETLIDGDMSLNDQTLTIRAQANPNGKAVAETALATLPNTYAQDVQIDLWDDGAPLQFTMVWDGTNATADGKLPANFDLNGPLGTTITPNGTIGFRPDEGGTFTANANAGVAALGLLKDGTLDVTANTLILTGTATSPQVNADLDVILSNAAPQTRITRDFTYLDDGTPASWLLKYGPVSGASIDGRLPTTLTVSDLAAALGLDDVAGNTNVALTDDTAGPAVEILTITARYLSEIEHLTLSRDGGGTALDLVVSPGVDIDLIAADLAQRLPPDAAFSIAPVDELPSQGAYRTNVITNQGEVYLNGFWIPDLNFVTSLVGCAQQTSAQLQSGGIRFLSGSARLDATSIRTINALAAIALPCVEADLELEILGHTDSSGDADENQTLSQDRAASVRAALIERGVPERAITSIGFGATRPVTDNETPEGRAANRRTEIDWFERGALRNP